MLITFYENGQARWGNGNYDPTTSYVFSVELLIHEFGHALNYGVGENTISAIFAEAYTPLGNSSVANTGVFTEDIRIWEPFAHGSNPDDIVDLRSIGRIYNDRWNPANAGNWQDERFAEAYAIWIYDTMNPDDSYGAIITKKVLL